MTSISPGILSQSNSFNTISSQSHIVNVIDNISTHVVQSATRNDRQCANNTEGCRGKEHSPHSRERTSISSNSSIPLTSKLREPQQTSRNTVTTLDIEIAENRKLHMAFKLVINTSILVLMVIPHAVVKIYISLENNLTVQHNSLTAYAITKWLRIASVAILPILLIVLNKRLLCRLRTLYTEAAPIMNQKRLSHHSIRYTTNM